MGETDRQNSRYQPQTLKSRIRKPNQEPPANQSRHKCCLCCWRLWVARISSQGPGLQGLGGFLHTELYPSQFRHDFPPRFLSKKQLSLPQIASLRLQQNSRINRKLESCCISQASFTGKERQPHTSLSSTHISALEPTVLKAGHGNTAESLHDTEAEGEGYPGLQNQHNLPGFHLTPPVPTVTHLPPGQRPARMGGKKEKLPRTVYWRPLSEPKTPPLCSLKRPQPETHPLPTAISEPLWYFCLEFPRVLADTPAIYFLYHRQRAIKSPREDTGGLWEGTEWMEEKRKLYFKGVATWGKASGWPASWTVALLAALLRFFTAV